MFIFFFSSHTRAMEHLEGILEETELNETQSFSNNRLVAFLHRPKGNFKGLELHASENEVRFLFKFKITLKFLTW